MKTLIVILSTLFGLCAIIPEATAQSGKLTKAANDKPISVQDAFRQVYNLTQEALAEVITKNDLLTDSLQLESIELTFETTNTTEGSAGIKLWVVSGSHTRSKSTGRKVTYTFKKEELNPSVKSKKDDINEFQKYLIRVLKDTRELEKVGQFALSEIDVEVNFTVTRNTEGKVEIALSPISPDGSVSRENETVHTIALNLSRVKRKKTAVASAVSPVGRP